MEEFYKDFGDFLAQKGYKKADELSADEVIKHNAEYLKEMSEHIKAASDSALKEKSEELKAEMLKAITDLQSQENAAIQKQVSTMLSGMKAQGSAIEKLMKGGAVMEVLSPFEKSIDDNMDKVKEGRGKAHGAGQEFVVKASFVAGSITGNTGAMRLTDISQIAHAKISIWDSLPKIPVSKDANGTVTYTDWDAATTVRAAAVAAEGGTFAESTAVFAENSITLKKIGDTIPISEESLYDRARFAAELKMFLETNVNLIADNQVYAGSGAGANMSGFKTTATAFTPVASGIAAPTIYDLAVKVKEAMVSGKNSKINPDRIYMHISDINEYKLEKDANNNYIMPPFAGQNGGVIDGMLVIESNQVTTNTMTVADSRFIKVYEEPGLAVSTGLSGTQFTADLVTLKARRRAEVLVRQADRLAVYQVTSISAALVTLAL